MILLLLLGNLPIKIQDEASGSIRRYSPATELTGLLFESTEISPMNGQWYHSSRK